MQISEGGGGLHVSPAVVLISCCDFSWYWHRPGLSELFTANQNVSRMPRNVHMCLLDRTVSLCMSVLLNLRHQSGWSRFFNTLRNVLICVCNICGYSVRWLRSGLNESGRIYMTRHEGRGTENLFQIVQSARIVCLQASHLLMLSCFFFFRRLCVAKEIMSDLMCLMLLGTCDVNESWWREQEAVQSVVSLHTDRRQ